MKFKQTTRKSLLGLPLFVATLLLAASSNAIPTLQIYIEGATYDHDIESWITDKQDLVLWVIGNTGAKGPILDVQLSAAYMTGQAGSISVTGTNTGLVADPSVSPTPGAPYMSADGEIPIMSDGSQLPRHGTYGAGVSFMQWSLGDFTLTDSRIGDFVDGFPTEFPQWGQINAYNINISSSISPVRFDVFNHVEGSTGALFGPFSHGGAVVPEPSTIALIGLGLAGSAFSGWRRKRSKRR